MSPSDALTVLKQTEATTYLVCAHCGQSILKGENYYFTCVASGRTLLPESWIGLSAMSRPEAHGQGG